MPARRPCNPLGALPIILAAAAATAQADPSQTDLRPADPIQRAMRNAGPLADRVYYDWVDGSGALNGGWITLPESRLAESLPVGPPPTRTVGEVLRGAGPAQNRIDVVFVGDGYRGSRSLPWSPVAVPPDGIDLTSEIRQYEIHVGRINANLFGEEPFTTYRRYFKVHRVDVVSDESGVDNDPVAGIDRDTALGMEYWCENIERLLCVNTTLAYGYAATVVTPDVVIAVANSDKYGGAGYPGQNIVTTPGANPEAFEVVQHELGHTIGLLADEYSLPEFPVYTGPEPFEANLSTLDAQAMFAQDRKWARWLGDSFPDYDGLVSTFAGGGNYQTGIYRPSNNSRMRQIGRPFNAPSLEAMVVGLYRIVDPIEGATPPGIVSADETLWVDPMDPFGHALTIEWYFNNILIADITGPFLDLSLLNITEPAEVLVRVIDNTELVRDPTARAIWLTSSRAWAVVPAGQAPIKPVDRALLETILSSVGREAHDLPGDLTRDGRVDQEDIALFLRRAPRAALAR